MPVKSIFVATVGLLLSMPAQLVAETLTTDRSGDERLVQVVRTYQIPVVKGKKNIAAIPAIMSFWGSTNRQVVLKSEFSYSVEPDKIDITSDNRGMRRRNYELTWLSPSVDKITVTQKLVIGLERSGFLCTRVKLPYSKKIAEAFPEALGKSEKINPDNPALDAICKKIAKTPWAEEAVERVCDYINENIEFKSGAAGGSDAVLADKQGNCTGMSQLACAMLRRIGIPAEIVSGSFMGRGGHAYIEVYFPDAGWVFYDLSNRTRAYKSLDVLMTTGYAFRVGDEKSYKWVEGRFLDVKDLKAYKEDNVLGKKRLRAGPKGCYVVGVQVVHRPPPRKIPVRHRPISSLIMDLSVPPGKRDYKREALADIMKDKGEAAEAADKPSSADKKTPARKK